MQGTMILVGRTYKSVDNLKQLIFLREKNYKKIPHFKQYLNVISSDARGGT